MRALLLLAMAALVPASPAVAQVAADRSDPVVEAVRAATARYRDRALAEEDGYRRIGPDIPAMGEHWVQVGLLLDPAVDVERPEILAYVPVDGEPRLAGVGWAVPLRGNEEPPPIPGIVAVWHAHGGPVEEELLQSEHAHGGMESGSRVAVVHAWVWVPNPAGPFAAENWALPALRLGLPPEAERNDEAARSLSLAGDGHAFLAWQIALLARLDEEEAALVSSILADAGAAVDGVLAGAGPAGFLSRTRPTGLTPAEREWLAAAWRDAGERVAEAVGPEAASTLLASPVRPAEVDGHR